MILISKSKHAFAIECSGYMAPEYAMEGLFSEKSDVFSFGVLLLEIVNGKRNNSFYHYERYQNLLGHVSTANTIHFLCNI